MSDTSDNGHAEEDMISEDLLALLYPEDAADSDADSKLDEQLQGMQGLRSLFADMPDEDPPDAISNKLLALAAQHAPTPKKESKGLLTWLSDLLLPLTNYPGLAAAASMVLVAGLAGTLYVSGRSKVAEPMAASPSPAPVSSATTLSAPSQPESAAGLQEQESAEGAAEMPTDLVAPEEPLAEDKALSPASQQPRKGESSNKGALEALQETDKIIGRLGSEKEKKSTKARIERSRSSSLDETRSLKKSKTKRQSKGKASYDSSALPERRRGSAGTRAPAPPVVSPPSPPASPAPSSPAPSSPAPSSRNRDGNAAQNAAPSPVQEAPRPVRKRPVLSDDEANFDAEEDLDDSAKQERAPKPALAAAKLHKQALMAAKKGQCDQVKALGRQIRTLSSSYYDRTFLSDAKLKSCLTVRKKK